jgi:hypothetical protein
MHKDQCLSVVGFGSFDSKTEKRVVYQSTVGFV